VDTPQQPACPRSLLFVPANRERFIAKLARIRPDAVILDLEDAIPAELKADARWQARAALERLAGARFARLVRINPLASGLAADDVRAVVCDHLDGIVLPKVHTAEELREANMLLAHAEARARARIGRVRVVAMIETVRAVLSAEAIAGAHPRVLGVAFGQEDYLLEVGGIPTREGLEVLFARSRVVAAARMAGVEPFDTPWLNVADVEGLQRETLLARQLGFSGKMCIHPDHLEVIHHTFTPSQAEVEHAQRVLHAASCAAQAGHGTAALDGRLVDAPIIARARLVLARAGRLDGP
jgi:citrate lyase beta subunit